MEANAANVAEDGDSSEKDELYDYNEEDEIKAAQKEAQEKALKEILANNGFAYRNILRSEKVKQHFTSPFSKENAMSPEDILLEIPKEDLHEVGLVQRRMYMPASFVQKWIIPTIQARNALTRHSIAWRIRNGNAVFDFRPIDLGYNQATSTA